MMSSTIQADLLFLYVMGEVSAAAQQDEGIPGSCITARIRHSLYQFLYGRQQTVMVPWWTMVDNDL